MMSARVLGSARGTVRSFFEDSGAAAVIDRPSESPDTPQSEIDVLTAALAERDARIAAHEAALADAYAEGEAAGRLAAEDEFHEDREKSLEALKDALVSARQQLADSLGRFESLALLVATEAVEKLTSNVDTYRTMLIDAIAAEVRAVESGTQLTIEVSRLDFPDTSEVAALAKATAAAGEHVVVSTTLEAGMCRIGAKLGSVEIDLLRSWDAMKAALAELAEAQG